MTATGIGTGTAFVLLLVLTTAEPGFFISKRAAVPDFDYAWLGQNASGEPDTLDYKVYVTYGGRPLSPWHDIPYSVGAVDGERLFSFVCEIPVGTTAKMEINKEHELNPIIQDTKKGQLRYYQYKPEAGSLVNYGAISQTWEHPREVHPDTGVGGDNDPIDALQLNEKPCQMGEVMPVRLLGVFALVDDGETDWKLLVVRADDPTTSHLKDVSAVSDDRKQELIEWFRRYKTAEGKGLNTFGLDERILDKAYATKICDETHAQWKKLMYGSPVGVLAPKPEDLSAKLLAAQQLERLRLSQKELAWVQALAQGWLGPLLGFMDERQYLQCLHYGHLVVNGSMILAPLPVVKTCSREDKERVDGSSTIALEALGGGVVATMTSPEVYEHRKEERAARTVGSTRGMFPRVKAINAGGDHLIGGRLEVLAPVALGDGLDHLRLTPAELLQRFAELGSDAVLAVDMWGPLHEGRRHRLAAAAAALRREGFSRPVLWVCLQEREAPEEGTAAGGEQEPEQARPGEEREEEEEEERLLAADFLALTPRVALLDLARRRGSLDFAPVVVSILPALGIAPGPREAQFQALLRVTAGATHYLPEPLDASSLLDRLAAVRTPGASSSGLSLSSGPSASEPSSSPSRWARMMLPSGFDVVQVSPRLQRLKIGPAMPPAAFDKTISAMALVNDTRLEDFVGITARMLRNLAVRGLRPPDGIVDGEGWLILERFFQHEMEPERE